MNVLSIQSSVAFGHVGNSAAAFVLQRLGHEVWPVDTVTLAHHPGYGAFRGRIARPAELTLLIDGIEARSAFPDCAAVLSGYLGTAALGPPLLEAVARVRRANPAARYCCCPVIGEVGTGRYVRRGIAEFFRDRAVPAADLVVLNPFELAWLTGRAVATPAEALAAARNLIARGPALVVATGLVSRRQSRARIAALAAEAGGRAWLAETPLIEAPASGAGDAFAALFLGHLLHGRGAAAALAAAITAIHAVMVATRRAGGGELALIAAQNRFMPTGKRLFKPRRMS